ncbi:MAG: site-specific integrase [Candidatus Obscuribacterales bacterium]|nr:site-specific integrase [Candidatus Obscuribacterales bacterium]
MNRVTLFGELFTLYQRKHVETRLKCPDNVKYWANVHLATWADQALPEITRFDVQDWVDELSRKSPSSATRAVNQLAAIFSWGIKRGYFAGPNPCSGIDKITVRSRDRFLLPDEFERFKRALDKLPEDRRDLFWMFLLTAARRSNILQMRWEEIDFALGVWRIDAKDYKNGETHFIPLTPPALAILQRRREIIKSPWVFPGRKLNQPLKEPKRTWVKLCKLAGVSDVRIHDLRRTVGSYLAIAGASPYIIQKTLGHKDQRSTAVYARLNLAPVRSALEGVQANWLS